MQLQDHCGQLDAQEDGQEVGGVPGRAQWGALRHHFRWRVQVVRECLVEEEVGRELVTCVARLLR